LRAFSDNFNTLEAAEAAAFARSVGKKLFAAVNIYASDSDFGQIRECLSELDKMKIDGLIISDMGVLENALRFAPNTPVHISTQANTTNAEAIKFYKRLGARRVVLARELKLDQIKKIRDAVDGIELECFVHGAMCVSYSGRCLLSNYLTDRGSNQGKCAQPCRWEYRIREASRPDNGGELDVFEDARGTYFMNGRDLCMIEHLDKLIDAGVDSFKIEGRMKSEYYAACVVNAYRRAFDNLKNGLNFDGMLRAELDKVGNRGYTTGFYFENDNNNAAINLQTSKAQSDYVFIANVLAYDERRGAIVIEQRNRFKRGDVLEIVSSGENFLKKLTVEYMEDEKGDEVADAARVQQKLFIKTDIRLKEYDILRRKI
jgi:putative protease